MSEVFKVCFGFAVLFSCVGLIFLSLDYFLQREARRQFYRDLLRLIILRENNSIEVFNREMPKILGTRIYRYSTYEKVMHEILFVYNSGLSGYQSVLAYALSLHLSYCVSTRELKKYKFKLLKEKEK